MVISTFRKKLNAYQSWLKFYYLAFCVEIAWKEKTMRQILIFIALFFIMSDSLSAQTQVYSRSNHMEFDGQYYEVSYIGIRNFMTDRSVYDPDIHKEIYPAFQRLKDKRTAALSVLIAGGSIGTIISLSSVSRVSNSSGIDSGFNTFITGISLVGVSGIVYAIIAPNRADYLSFISQHNVRFKDRQIKLGFTLVPNGLPGAGLALQF